MDSKDFTIANNIINECITKFEFEFSFIIQPLMGPINNGLIIIIGLLSSEILYKNEKQVLQSFQIRFELQQQLSLQIQYLFKH